MTKKKVSLGDVARAAGVSTTSAGYALRSLPGLGEATRRHILEVAQRLNYFPDPRLAATMAGIRQAADKDLLPVVWLNTQPEKDAWQKYDYLSPFQEGAREGLRKLGYRIEEIWTKGPGYSLRKIAHIIDRQGIEGVLVTDPAKHVRLNWKRLAGVSIGGGLFAPALHRVTMDSNFNLSLALKSVKRLGFQRVGICLTEEVDRLARHGMRSLAMYFNSAVPQARRVKPLFTPHFLQQSVDEPLVAAWLQKERPDVVICHTSFMVEWVQSAGFRVPADIGVVHLAIEDDVLDWAGIYSNKREVGRLAAIKLVSLIQHRQFGIPTIASTESVPGAWRATPGPSHPRK